jgi:thiamine pyrophosphate-dependent acetolactate synthase large subunit-like protein
MVRMSGARAFLECLKLEGVKYIFGNPGTTEVALLEALCGFPEITYVLALQEGVAIGMADGYARGSGEIGVVNVHTAVGTANTIGGIYTSYLGKSPVLVTITLRQGLLAGEYRQHSESNSRILIARLLPSWETDLSSSPSRASGRRPSTESPS